MTLALGAHYAVTEADLNRVKVLAGTETLVAFLANEIEPVYTPDWTVDTDKAWEGIHRAFSDSTFFYELETPLHGVILGGEPLTADDSDVVIVKTTDEVHAIHDALTKVDRASFQAAYDRIDPDSYQTLLSQEDFAYCWDNLVDLKSFYARAAAADRAVLFTAY